MTRRILCHELKILSDFAALELKLIMLFL